MPFCPNCHYEYIEGIVQCPECGARLTQAPPVPEAVPPEYVRLTTASDPAAGLAIQVGLQEAGIPVIVQNYGPVTGALAAVADDITEDYSVLFVPEDRLEEALRLVQAMETQPAQWPEGMEPED